MRPLATILCSVACRPRRRPKNPLGVIGTPLVDTHSRFLRIVTYGDMPDIQVTIPQWREKRFVDSYRLMRGEELIMDCDEVRIFAGRRTDNTEAKRSLLISPDIRRLCD